jgi:hypothetical protein
MHCLKVVQMKHLKDMLPLVLHHQHRLFQRENEETKHWFEKGRYPSAPRGFAHTRVGLAYRFLADASHLALALMWPSTQRFRPALASVPTQMLQRTTLTVVNRRLARIMYPSTPYAAVNSYPSPRESAHNLPHDFDMDDMLHPTRGICKSRLG